MMKRVLYLALAMVIVFSLAACGSKDGAGDNKEGSNPGGNASGSSSPESSSPETSAISDSGSAISAQPLSEALAWWDGEWYGYWKVSSADNAYEDYDGGEWDCYAVIDVAADNTATVYFWDDEIELAVIELIMYTDAGGIMGGATSESGTLFGFPSEHADWVISPNFNTYDDMIVIQEWFSDPDGDGFRYEVFLRPWGMLWDDVPSGDRPPDYDSWYIGQSAHTKTMYDALYEPDGGVFIHPRLLDGATGGSSGGGAGGSSGGSTGESSGGSTGGSAASGGNADGSTGSGGAGLSGPTAEITLGVGDVYSISYPTNTFDFSDTFGAKLSAKDGSVAIHLDMQKSNESLESLIEFLDSYGSFEGYSTEDLTVAGFKARRITYKDWGGEDVSKVFIIFNSTGGIGGYHGVFAEIISEKDLASTWTPEIRAILETSKVAQ